MDLYFVAAAGEYRRAASWTECSALVVIYLSRNRDGVLGVNGSGIKQRPVVFSAVEAVANPNAVGGAGCSEAHCAAKTAAGLLAHDFLPHDIDVRPAHIMLG